MRKINANVTAFFKNYIALEYLPAVRVFTTSWLDRSGPLKRYCAPDIN